MYVYVYVYAYMYFYMCKHICIYIYVCLCMPSSHTAEYKRLFRILTQEKIYLPLGCLQGGDTVKDFRREMGRQSLRSSMSGCDCQHCVVKWLFRCISHDRHVGISHCSCRVVWHEIAKPGPPSQEKNLVLAFSFSK